MIYREEQRLAQGGFLKLLVCCVSLYVIYDFVSSFLNGGGLQKEKIPLLITGALVIPFVFLYMRLVTEVYPDSIDLRFIPFPGQSIKFPELESCEIREYRPFREYGGYGIRGFGKNRAYNCSGRTGLQLVLKDGKRVLIGTQRPEELLEAVKSACPQIPSS